MIVVLAGNDHVDANAALLGVRQLIHHAAIGEKVGRGDVDGFASSCNQCLEKHAGARRSSAGWCTGDYQRRRSARVREGWRKVISTIENLPGSLEIIFEEGALNRPDGIALYADHGIAPSRFGLGSIPPPIRISGATHEGCNSIDEGDFTMGAVVDD